MPPVAIPGLPVGLNRPVELAGGKVPAADHRPDLAGCIFQAKQGRLDLGHLLERQDARVGVFDPHLD